MSLTNLHASLDSCRRALTKAEIERGREICTVYIYTYTYAYTYAHAQTNFSTCVQCMPCLLIPVPSYYSMPCKYVRTHSGCCACLYMSINKCFACLSATIALAASLCVFLTSSLALSGALCSSFLVDYLARALRGGLLSRTHRRREVCMRSRWSRQS